MSYSLTPDDIDFRRSAINIHSTPEAGQPLQHTQLCFNFNPKAEKAQIQKPRPIIIEKLVPRSTQHVKYETAALPQSSSYVPETMISSERLSIAVQLAKLDIKKLKTMLNTDDEVGATEKRYSPKISKMKNIDADKPKRVKKGIGVHKKDPSTKQNRHVLHLYPVPKKDSETRKEPVRIPQEIVAKQKEKSGEQTSKDEEVLRLRNDLFKYSRALNLLVQRLNEEKFVDVLQDDDEFSKERQRNIIRAEEQGSRSARTLYMLQRKVQELQNEITSKSNTIKHTKKSQYMNNLTSTHRAAVRALQTFVTHAPLYYNSTGKLPPIYNALALLIQQLTALPSGSSMNVGDGVMDTIEDLIFSLSKVSEKKQPLQKGKMNNEKSNRGVEAKPTKKINLKKQYLDKHIDWLKQKADELNIKSFQENDESTPDRASSLRHAIKSISENELKLKQNPGEGKLKGKEKGKKKSKTSVLLPQELKNKRLKIPSRAYHPQPPESMNYATATVVSKIREKPLLERKEKGSPQPSRRTVGFIDGPSTPKKRDKQIIEEARSFLSPRQRELVIEQHSHPLENEVIDDKSNFKLMEKSIPSMRAKMMEKEVSRDNWLLQRKLSEMSKLDAIGEMNTQWFEILKKEFEESQYLVKQAEQEIKDRLKPLLEKAEVISQDEAKREEKYKTSVNQRLAEVASQRAMSSGERIAEYILDDLIREAALDIHRIEDDEHAEMDAALLFDQQNIEAITQRLNAFEIEEEEIRRRWKCVQYSELDSDDNKNVIDINKDSLDTSHTAARSVMFTAPINKRPLPPKPEDISQSVVQHRGEISVPDHAISNILLHRERFENYLNKSIHNSWSINPHEIIEELCEQILDGLVIDVSNELNENCSNYVDDIYEKEFLNTT